MNEIDTGIERETIPFYSAKNGKQPKVPRNQVLIIWKHIQASVTHIQRRLARRFPTFSSRVHPSKNEVGIYKCPKVREWPGAIAPGKCKTGMEYGEDNNLT